ncbi:MAG: GTP 3',8-cyclase MoaA [Myxococcales bacterium]|nr:GTP 3',8-cyclase MoaA [Myxococcales bacterium]
MAQPQQITDGFGRVFDYLRVAVTERCNLRCVYCMPEEGIDFKGGERLMSSDELVRLVGVFAKLGVRKVRLTGGEPLVRKDILQIVSAVKRTDGIEDVGLTTNGVLFERFARRLRLVGLDSVNISLDTLDAERFASITRRAGLPDVLAAIDRAVKLGFPRVKVNVVAMRGFNDDELGAFGALTRELPITVRFIELMPFDAHQVWKRGRFVGADKIVAALHEAFPELVADEGSATEGHVFRAAGHAGKLAVIPAFTRSICAGCDRIRLTADGKLRNCLFSEDEFDLLGPLREGADDAALSQTILEAMRAKLADGWQAQNKAATREQLADHELDPRARQSMTQIGG